MTKADRALVDTFMKAQAEPTGRMFSENVLAGIKACLAARSEAIQKAYDHLMNLQPHIEQLPKEYRGFIDPHVDEAMKLLASLLPQRSPE